MSRSLFQPADRGGGGGGGGPIMSASANTFSPFFAAARAPAAENALCHPTLHKPFSPPPHQRRNTQLVPESTHSVVFMASKFEPDGSNRALARTVGVPPNTLQRLRTAVAREDSRRQQGGQMAVREVLLCTFVGKIGHVWAVGACSHDDSNVIMDY